MYNFIPIWHRRCEHEIEENVRFSGSPLGAKGEAAPSSRETERFSAVQQRGQRRGTRTNIQGAASNVVGHKIFVQFKRYYKYAFRRGNHSQ